jgi:hypothetical protein
MAISANLLLFYLIENLDCQIVAVEGWHQVDAIRPGTHMLDQLNGYTHALLRCFLTRIKYPLLDTLRNDNSRYFIMKKSSMPVINKR